MLSENSIRKIVIVGGGTAGWMAASAFGKLLVHPDIEICLVESEAIGTVGVGEATIPHIRYFNTLLGLQEDDFVRQTNATFKLGIEFVDWARKGESYIHPFGAYGVDMEGLRFHQYWLRHTALGREHPLDDYNLQVMAAKAEKFQRPMQEPNSPLGQIEYAFHFDSNLYAKYLRAFAEQRGVNRKEGKVVSVGQNADTGFVESVTLDSGETIEGELFIDCSGFRGLLIEQTLKSGYEDWSKYLSCNSAVTIQSRREADPVPYTRSTAKEAGWQWRIPLQSRTGNGYVYSRDHISDEAALDTLLHGLDGEPFGEPRILRFTGGIRNKSWNRNVIALGLAAGFMEPLESTSIHLIQTAIARIMTLFPDRHFNQSDIDYYNSRTLLEFEQVRDFLVLHYKATQRDDTPFWRYCRDMEIPDSLRERIALYEENGRLYRHDNELFGEHSWLAVMHGQGLAPKRYHPLTEMMPEGELDKRMGDIRRIWKNCLDRMPGHQEFIDQNCRAN